MRARPALFVAVSAVLAFAGIVVGGQPTRVPDGVKAPECVAGLSRGRVDSQAGHEALSRFATAQSLDVRKHAREVEAQPRLLQRTISVGGRRCGVVAVIVPVGTHRVAVALANGRVGSTAPLGQIASSRGAVAAINGCYFDAYTSSKVKQPWHTIISNGSLCAIGNVGSVLGFQDSLSWRLERLCVGISGEVGTKRGPLSWYAYRVNCPVSGTGAYWFNRLYVSSSTPGGGTQITVRNDVVTSISAGPETIPDDGYVLVYTGQEMSQGDRFVVGARCRMHITYGSQDEAFWSQVRDAIGCGPTLLRGGEPVVDPEGEGFREQKVAAAVARRSLIGVRQDGTVVMAITSASPPQAAEVLRKLGAVDGMCLDGGASSGLWYRGRYQVRPGRDISNAWVVVPEERKKPPAEDASKANSDLTPR